MVQRLKRISFCSLAFILLAAGSLGTPSFAAATVGQDNANRLRTESGKRLRHTSPRRRVASTEGSKQGRRTIIFVGGRKGSQGAARTPNPKRARTANREVIPGLGRDDSLRDRRGRTVNGELNPQPIPPGKSHLHPPGLCRKSRRTPCPRS
jgi:hypothetical protein